MFNFNPLPLFVMGTKLAPFIIVSVLSFYSIFANSINGAFYLAGLLIASVIATMVGNVSSYFAKNDADPLKCNVLSIGEHQRFSNIPLGLITINYTFWFLMVIIIKYNLVMTNLPTIIIFPFLILAHIYYELKCAKPISILLSILIGSAVGAGLVAYLDKVNIIDRKKFNPLENR